MEIDKLDKLKSSLESLKNKTNNIYFFSSPVSEPNSSTYEIYKQANTLAKNGYNVTIFVDNEELLRPSYVDEELFEGVSLRVLNDDRLNLMPEDVLVIPEVLTNVMEQTKNTPCTRIVLHQSIDYMYNALMLMTGYHNFGINNIIVNSSEMGEYLKKTIGGNTFDIKKYEIGIPEYFKADDKPKDLVVSFLTRNPNDISKLAKDFYSKYPQYSFLTFQAMFTDGEPPQPLTRKQFADKLKNNFAAVWIDRISSFGTFPLECMKAGTIVIGLIPDFISPYMVNEKGELQNNGVWVNNIYELSDYLGKLVSLTLDDVIPQEMKDNMKTTSDKYSVENSEKTILETYEYFIGKRIKNIEEILNK